jgi:phosphinothricin acetyltransferase
MQPADWPDVRRIYLEGIATGNATFETDAPPSWDELDRNRLPVCRHVAELGGAIVGWVMLSAISSRAVYRGVAEVSVYVANEARGKGVGAALMEKLVDESEALGFWTLQAGILVENEASIELHKRAGFREVGRRERMGQLRGKWRNVLLMERRSAIVE